MLPERELIAEVRRVFPRQKYTGFLSALMHITRKAEDRRLPYRFVFVCKALGRALVTPGELPEPLRQGILQMPYGNALKLLVRATLECGHKPHRLVRWLHQTLVVKG